MYRNEAPDGESETFTFTIFFWRFEKLLAQLRSAQETIESHLPERITILGGDCLADLAPSPI